MAQVDVLNWKKQKVGQLELDARVFEADVNKQLLHSVVRWQLAGRRQGTHMTKTKGLVSGGGKKPFKQKGTGNARQGSNRSPLMPGGGTMFGPQPRDYSYTLPKKVRRAALVSALSYLFKEGRLIVLDDISSSAGKTKELVQNLNSLGLNKAVLVDAKAKDLVSRAARNLEKFRYYGTEGLNVFDLLKYDAAVISKDSLDLITQRCLVGNGK